MNISGALKRIPSKLEEYLRADRILGFCWKIIRLVILLGFCFLIIYPFFIKVVNGVKSFNDFLDPTVRFLPKEPTIEYFKLAFHKMNYLPTLGRTAFLSVLYAFIQTCISAVIGYGFARFRFRGNKFIFACVILVLLVPPQTIMIPLYEQFRFFMGSINLIDTIYPMLILSFTGLGLRNGLYVFMFRQFFRNTPKELEEAAYIDGCGTFKTFVIIIMPSARSVAVAVALFSFSWQWTDLFYNDLFFSDQTVLASSISTLKNTFPEPIMDSMLQNVGAVLAVAPLLLLYLVTQRAFVQSMERSGIVG